MKTKTLNLMLTSILALVFLIAGVSAVSLNDITQYTIPSNATHNAGSFVITFNLTNTGVAGTLDFSASAITSGTANITFNDNNIADGSTTPVTETITATVSYSSHQSGNIAGTIDVIGQGASTHKQLAFSVSILSSSSLSVSDASISAGSNSTTITITNTGNTALTGIALNDTGDFDVVFNTTAFDLAAGATKNVLVSINEDISDLLGGDVTITASSGSTSDTGIVSLGAQYCQYGDYGNDGKLDVSLSVDNVAGFGDDSEWYPFDELEVEITIENKGDEDVDDITVEWGLYNTKTNEWYVDDEENEFNLKKDKEKVITVSFSLDDNLEDLDGGDFVFYARATGKVDGGTKDGQSICSEDSYSDLEVITEPFVLINDIEVQEITQCGADLQISGELWNIGDDDQSDVYLTIFNSELGLNQKLVVGDIDAFDREGFSTTVKIPTTASEKYYTLKLSVFDEDNELFESDNGDEAEFSVPVKVEGGCSVASPAAVSAILESGGKAGDPLVIKSTITNTGNSTATYSITAASYADWADSATLNMNSVTLNAGESKDIQVTLGVKKDVSGEKSFDIELVSNSQLVAKQPVSVVIEKSGFSISGITGNVIGGGSWYLWAIGAINVILVVIIIVVALRVAKS